MTDRAGGAIEITDCAPRFLQHGRLFQPMTLLRQVRRIAGNPRVVVRLRPACRYGSGDIATTVGSNHIRYVGSDLTLRLTTDASLTAVLEERAFFLDDAITSMLGADETITENARDLGRTFVERTLHHWRDWVRGLAIPFEWQAAVIRAAITLQAQCLRRHRRDRRGGDDLDSGGPRLGPQLGLSVLLAARRLLRRQRAQPARRHRDDGALPAAIS